MAKQTNENEIFENPDVLVEKINQSEEFVKKNKVIIGGAIVGVIALVLGFFFFQNSSKEKEAESQLAIYKAQYYFGLDSLNLALSGNEDFSGFEDLASTYSDTKAGNLASFYIGLIAYKQGDFEKAAQSMTEYETEAFIISARANAVAGDAYSEIGNNAKAIEYYNKAAKDMPNEKFTPRYLFKLAAAYEAEGKHDDAVITYQEIINEYPGDPKVNDARKYLAKASTLAAKNKK